MDVPLLIDGVVRQTMVLIAELATSGGNRAPLAHVADQVFRDLTAALEQQGVRRNVAADMFGLALRSYQQKVRRLSESASDDGRSLWESIYEYLCQRQVASRAEVLRRFARDDHASVVGILNDLAESGLLYRTGRGDESVLRVAPSEDLARVAQQPEHAALVVWSIVHREGPLTLDALAERTRIEPDRVRQAIDHLVNEGRVTTTTDAHGVTCQTRRVLIPLGEAAGWEAGLLDHFQAVVASICVKLRNGSTRALPDDEVGGSTFTFDIWPGHTSEERVRSLLKKHRAELCELWDEVTRQNAAEGPREGQRVTFYVGQSVTDRSEMPDTSEVK